MKNKIRVGLLLNSYHVSYPYYHIIDTLRHAEYAEICVVVLNTSEKKVTAQKITGNLKYVLFHLYQRIDKKIFKPKHNVLYSRNSRELLTGIPVVEVHPQTNKKYFQSVADTDIQKIKEHHVDVFIRMGFKILKGEILNSSKYGIWSYHHADNKVNRGGPPGFWEMYYNNNVTGTIVQVLTSDLDNGKVLARSFSGTHKYSLNRSRNAVYAKGMFMLPRLVKKLYENGDAFLDAPQQFPELYSHRLYSGPTNWQMIKFLSKLIPQSLLKSIRQMVSYNQWYLMFAVSRNEFPQPSMRKLKKLFPPQGKFWADPHIIYRDNKYYVFIEEKEFRKKRAHIALITIDEKGNCSSAQKVLERPYHLSYPFVFSFEGTEYMIPETSANKTVEIYKCKQFPDQWELHAVLLQDITGVDCTLHFYNNRWWMFINQAEHPAVSNNDELFIYHSDSPFGPWTSHKKNPVISDVRRARPAGRIFTFNNKMYRPSQDCSVTYGYGIRINEITELSEENYSETEIDFVEPLWEDKIKGVHTFSFENRMTMIDGFRKVPFWK